MSLKQSLDVLFILPKAEVGGTELQTIELASRLQDLKLRTEIWFLSGGGPLEKNLEARNIPYRSFGRESKNKIFSSTKSTLKLCVALFSIEVRNIHSQLTFPVVVSSLLLSRITPKAKIVSGVRGIYNAYNFFYNFLLGKALRKSDLVIVNSENLISYVMHKFGVKEERIKLVFNSVTIPKLSREKKSKNTAAIVISNFLPVKNLNILLEIALSSNISINLFGRGDLKSDFLRKVKSLGLQNKIKVHSNDLEKSTILSTSGFAIHPSFSEGMSNAVLEELSYGLPVLASNIESNAKLVIDGRNGFLLDPHNPSAWVLGVERLLNLLEDNKEVSKFATEKAQEFSWENGVRNHLKLYFLNPVT